MLSVEFRQNMAVLDQITRIFQRFTFCPDKVSGYKVSVEMCTLLTVPGL